jgi:SAM-dependent methyltransferase
MAIVPGPLPRVFRSIDCVDCPLCLSLNVLMGTDPALKMYEAFAAVYDDFNHLNDYEMWLGRTLLPALRRHGLKEGGKALDVGCGTGRAFPPLLERGWQVHGCDLSPAMLEVAAKKGGPVALDVADLRSLPLLGSFDLVLALNDCLNYLLGDEDLVHALSGMRANLAKRGILVFDVNSRSTFASGYSEVREVEHEGSRWQWNGRGEVAPSVYEAEIAGDKLEPVRQRERFRPVDEVLEAMQAAGLHVLAAYGMREAQGAVLLSEPPDEHRDYKLVFIGARDDRPASPSV